MGIPNLIVLLGGIALFLFGMSLMGSGLKKVAGDKMELILYRLSGTPLKGILLGTGVTAVIQSSSATSVMVVGFVNSGMMKLRQAIGVVMGAIIGTSVTGWIICLSSIGGEGAANWASLLSTEVIGAVVSVIGIILWMFSKKKNSKNLGEILMGFSVLMFGMKSMSSAVSVLKTNDAFINFMTDFSNPFLGILLGVVITAILQSASASVGILQALSATGVISLNVALPIILGISVGAALPVLMSAIGADTNGKRTAFSYLYITAIGAAVVGAIFYAINSFAHFSFMSTITDTFIIAGINTLFRIVMIIIEAPFIALFEKLAMITVRDKKSESDETKELTKLDERFLQHPPVAVEQTRLSINEMARKTQESIENALGLFDNYDEKIFDKVIKDEEVIDKYEDSIGSYLMKLTGRDLTDDQNSKVSEFLHTVSDFERISDHARNIAESAKEMKDKDISFTEEGTRELGVLFSAILDVVSTTFTAFIDNDHEMAYRVEPFEEVIDDLVDELNAHHVIRMQEGKCTFKHGYIFNDLLSDIERVSDHCSNVGVAVIETNLNTFDAHEYTKSVEETKANNFDEYFNEYKEKYKI